MEPAKAVRNLIARIAETESALSPAELDEFENELIRSRFSLLAAYLKRFDPNFVRTASFAQRAVAKRMLRKLIFAVHPNFARIDDELPSNQLGKAALSQFRDAGIGAFGEYIDRQQHEEIRDYLKPFPVYNAHIAGCSDGKGRYIGDPEDPAEAYQFGSYAEDVIAQAPHIRELVLRPELLKFLTAYFGVPPLLRDLHLWWSFPRPSAFGPQPYAGQGFHRDYAGLQDTQFFICLNDMPEGDGSHEYFSGTHDPEVFSRQFPNHRRLRDMPVQDALERIFFPLGDGYGRYPGDTEKDADWLDMLQSSVVRVPMRARHCFMIDTNGLHRGVPPAQERRIVFSARFGACGGAMNLSAPARDGAAAIDELTYCIEHYRARPGNAALGERWANVVP